MLCEMDGGLGMTGMALMGTCFLLIALEAAIAWVRTRDYYKVGSICHMIFEKMISGPHFGKNSAGSQIGVQEREGD